MNKPYAELHARPDYWKAVVSHCRSLESGAIRHQNKIQRQTLAERYENSVFRLTPCTAICIVATTARNFVRSPCWIVFADRKHRQRISLLRRSLVRMLCHMVHMASCMRGMVDEPLQHACTPFYPARPHVPNHSTIRYAWAMSTNIDFRSRSGPLFSMFGRSLRNGSTSATLTHMTCLDKCVYLLK